MKEYDPDIGEWWIKSDEQIYEFKNKLEKIKSINMSRLDECQQIMINEIENKLTNLKEFQRDCFILQVNKPFLFALYKKEKLPTHTFLAYYKNELKDIPSIYNIYLTTKEGFIRYEEVEFSSNRRGISEYIYNRDVDPVFPSYIKINEFGKKFVVELKKITSEVFFVHYPDLAP